MAKDLSRKVEILGNYGALLSMIEVGLGSILHSMHVPFSGLFLSLNQGYLLCRVAILTQENWMSYSVSNIAACLKSLSPAGNKLGPMLSLSMQGLLFNLGTLIFGINPLGLIIGMILLSFWSFVQPVITYYLFFGDKLFNAAEFLYQKTLPYHGIEEKYLIWFFSGIVLLKAVAAAILAIIAWKTKGKIGYQEEWAKLAKRKPVTDQHPAILALKDLLRPIFLISLFATGMFLYFSQHKMAEIVWYLMRPVAIGFIFFYFSRTLTLDRWLLRLHGGRFESFAKGCEIALTKVRKVI
jgi:hypothetical protein